MKPGPWDTDGREIYQKAYLNDEKYNEIYNYSVSQGLDCFASVFNMNDFDRLKKISDKFIKFHLRGL